MATYNKSLTVTIPLVSLAEDASLGKSPFEIAVPLADYETDTDYYEVQNVAAAFLFDASGPTYTDYTTEANDAAAGDVFLLPSPIGAGDYFLVGGSSKYDFVTFEVGTAGTGTYTLSFSYWNGTGWTALVVPTDLIYETVNHFKTTWLVRLTLKSQPADWTAMTVGGKHCYYLRFAYVSGTLTVQPVGDQIWLGVWTVAHTQSWSDTQGITDLTVPLSWQHGHGRNFTDIVQIDDESAGKGLAFDVIKTLFDTVIIDDESPGKGMAWSAEKHFADVMTIADSLTKDVSKTFADLVTIVATLYLGNNMLISDMLGITDRLVFTVNRVFQDTVVIADVLIRDVHTYFADNMTLADAWDKTPTQHWFDAIDIADTLYKSLMIGEVPSDVVETLTNPSLLTGPWMPYIAIGTSNITQDQVIGRITSLFGEVYRKRANVRVMANTYFASAEFGQDEPTADDLVIYEIGLFDAPEGGNMAARWVLNTGSAKDNIDEIVIETAITVLHGTMYRQELSFTGDVGSEMIASILAAGGSSVAGAKDTQTMSDTLTWKLNDVDI